MEKGGVRLKKKIFTVLCILVLTIGATATAEATSISDIQKQQQETQRQLDMINESLSDLKGKRPALMRKLMKWIRS